MFCQKRESRFGKNMFHVSWIYNISRPGFVLKNHKSFAPESRSVCMFFVCKNGPVCSSKIDKYKQQKPAGEINLQTTNKLHPRLLAKHESRLGPKHESRFGPKRESRFGSKRESRFASKHDSRFGLKQYRRLQVDLVICGFSVSGNRKMSTNVFSFDLQ